VDDDSLFGNADEPSMTAEALWDSLDLQNNKIDRTILYEITRRRIDGFELDPD